MLQVWAAEIPFDVLLARLTSFWQSMGWELGGKPVLPFFQLDTPRPVVYLLCLLYVLVSDFPYKLCICVASTPLKVFA